MNEVKGYKVFKPDWTCRDKQYTCPGKFEEDVSLSVCNRGMHFCKKAVDCFRYYDFNPSNRVAEVIAYGEVAEYGDKCCTDKLEIVREIPWAEVLELVNAGEGCTGKGNSGDWNSGDWNSGNRNSGNRNSGDWNKTNYATGCFNTEETTIMMFNKPSDMKLCDWHKCNARYILNRMPFGNLVWVDFSDMTNAEKEQNPNAETTGGYLKKERVTQERKQKWYEALSEDDKNAIKALPNFDADIFEEITGIDVRKDGTK